MGNKLDKLKLSYLLRRIPTLIIQTKSDKATTYGMLIEEYNEIAQNKNISLKVFEKGSHTRIYAEPDYKKEYTEAVANFLKGIEEKNVQENEEKGDLNPSEVSEKEQEEANVTEYYEKFSDFDFDEN